MTRYELLVIVERVGRETVCQELEWNRVTLWRKLNGKSRIYKPEAFMLRNCIIFKAHGPR